MDAPNIVNIPRRYFRHGLIVNLLNSKAAIFYIAVLPTYIGSLTNSSSVTVEAVSLTLVYVGIATFIHLVIVMLGSRLQTVFSNSEIRKPVARVLAILLALIAVWMVVKAAP
jgi:threonine/homoserine/homoserine lactone efflux protein